MRLYLHHAASVAILIMAILWAHQQHQLAKDLRLQQKQIAAMIGVQSKIVEIEKFRLCRAGDFIPNYEKPEFCGDGE